MTQKKELQKSTVSSSFTDMVIKEFTSTSGMVEFDNYKKKLCQHMFIKIDAQLKDLEAKRLQSDNQVTPYEWNNINMEKLAIDTVHRVDLGLDALIPNHISPIPYYNKKKGKYDLDLRVGYEGKNLYRRKMAIDVPLNIIYELVYSTDIFKPIKAGVQSEYDCYEFQITSPFDRGDIVGGFGYIVFSDNKKNILVIVTEKEFIKSKNAAQSKIFWNDHPEKMRMKTLVHRTTEHLKLDPEKINASFMHVENDSYNEPVSVEAEVEREIEENANAKIIDIEPVREENKIQQPLSEEEELIQRDLEELKQQELNGPDF